MRRRWALKRNKLSVHNAAIGFSFFKTKFTTGEGPRALHKRTNFPLENQYIDFLFSNELCYYRNYFCRREFRAGNALFIPRTIIDVGRRGHDGEMRRGEKGQKKETGEGGRKLCFSRNSQCDISKRGRADSRIFSPQFLFLHPYPPMET